MNVVMNIKKNEEVTIKPQLKYLGNKAFLGDFLTKVYSNYNSYRWVELFCGSLGATIKVNPENALLNDLNPVLIGFYNFIKYGGEYVSMNLLNTHGRYKTNKEKYNEYLEKLYSNAQLTIEERKELYTLFIWLNHAAYNGVYRLNKSGFFNVPKGTYRKSVYDTDLEKYREMYKKWSFETSSYDEVNIQEDDFLYCDPPYHENFVMYTKEGFNWQDQTNLCEYLSKLSNPLVVSNSAYDDIMQLYSDYGFTVYQVECRRSIKADSNRVTLEMLATKNIPDNIIKNSFTQKLKLVL